MSRELRTYTFTVVVETADEMWHAYCPTLLTYGAATWDASREEALAHIREVVEMIVERLVPLHRGFDGLGWTEDRQALGRH